MQEKIEFYIKKLEDTITYDEYEYFATIGENNFVERKSIRNFDNIDFNKDKIKSMLSKEVSAFSNYYGGVILLGVDDQTGAIQEGILNLYKNRTVKEWLEDILWSVVSPSIKSFSIKTVQVANSKVLFAVFIGNSTLLPHQAAVGTESNKYFLRVESKSRPIDGYLVKDLMNRISYADLDLKLSVLPNQMDRNPAKFALLGLDLINQSNIPAKKVLVLMLLSQDLINGAMAGVSVNKGQFNVELSYPDLIHCLVEPRYSAAYHINLKKFDLITIDFTIVAENMKKREMSFFVHRIGDNFIITKK